MVRSEKELLDAAAVKGAWVSVPTQDPRNSLQRISHEVEVEVVHETCATWVGVAEEEVWAHRCLSTFVGEKLHQERHRPS